MDDKRIQHAIILRYLVRILVQAVAWGGILIVLVFAAFIWAAQGTWYASDPLYQVLSFIRDYILLFALLFWLGGLVAILVWQWRRVARHFLLLTSTIRQMQSGDESPIVLPGDLREIQAILQQVQTESIRNRHLAAEAEQRKNDLVVYLAHDLKTPLTSVLGYLTLLRDEKDISPELRQKYLDIAANKAMRLEDLVNEFFEITRFSLKGLALEPARLDLSRMLEQLCSEFGPLFTPKNLTCRLDIQPGLAMTADAGKLERVFDNLLRNAVSYSYPDSEILVRLYQAKNQYRVLIQNRGDTIPPHKLAHIFEQFYRLGSARATEDGGAGLGLAIAKEIIELHEGRITVKSENNVIEFMVELPAELQLQPSLITTASYSAGTVYSSSQQPVRKS